MKKLGLNEIRAKFLEFFESKGHYIRKSYSLVPENDKSLLLINAGMAPLKPYFMGIENPPKTRMVTCQKCIRTGDIENVGKTARHATFFEMLGNFSFGDYFKNESISWGWEFVTKNLNIPEDKLWVTVYEEDDEAYEIWNKKIGISKDRIVRLGKEDNFWEIGIGPCGPCSEIYFDRGEKYGCDNPDCKPGCECDRYVEFWNHVFTQFNKDEKGNYSPLSKKNIDTGMGLERVACLMQGVETIFEVDTIKYILDHVISISNQKYEASNKSSDVSIRIITDHIRAVTFLVSDGVIPSNEGRGYVVRRLLRRAARHGKLIGINKPFLAELSQKVIDVSKEAYPELNTKSEYIHKIISIEEERFQETIDQGNNILVEYMNELKTLNSNTLSGDKAFKLYDTYGFPLELTEEILEENSYSIDIEGFNKCMELQKNQSRSARGNNDDKGWEGNKNIVIDGIKKTIFVGYNSLESESNILAILNDENKDVKNSVEGKNIKIILDKTPFYAESGGQVGDVGLIFNDKCKIKINKCTKYKNIFIHEGKVIEGKINKDDTINASVNKENRFSISKNHTATHLLHKALKNTLGEHIEQAGSLVTKDKLRFDFSHYEPISKEDLLKIEEIVNNKISENLDLTIEEMGIKDAIAKGATALFEEKYEDIVRVVNIDEYSIELCGGTHVNNTSEIGMFKIISETGVAAGVRRIEALTGLGVYNYVRTNDNILSKVENLLKTNSNNVVNKVESILKDLKIYQKEVETLKLKLASNESDSILDSKYQVDGINVITYKFKEVDNKSLREIADKLKDKLKSGVIVLASETNGKVILLSMVTDDVVGMGLHAGNIIKQVSQIAGGSGGGKPSMAQAGAKDPSKIDDALIAVENIIKQMK